MIAELLPGITFFPWVEVALSEFSIYAVSKKKDEVFVWGKFYYQKNGALF